MSVAAGQESCTKLALRQSPLKDIKALGYITMALMNREEKYDGNIGVHDIARWPVDGKANHFLRLIQATSSFTEVKEVRHLLLIHLFVLELTLKSTPCSKRGVLPRRYLNGKLLLYY